MENKSQQCKPHISVTRPWLSQVTVQAPDMENKSQQCKPHISVTRPWVSQVMPVQLQTGELFQPWKLLSVLKSTQLSIPDLTASSSVPGAEVNTVRGRPG